MAVGSIFGNGVSALLANQRALATVGHNISNVNTEGYNRQRVEFIARPPQGAGQLFIGSGVNVGTIQRVFNEQIVEQVRTSATGFNQFDTLHRLASQIDNLLADPGTGLSPALQDFFDAVDTVADDPTSIPSRQVMLGQAESLARRAQFMDARLRDIENQINSELTTVIGEINSIAAGIADANLNILVAEGQIPSQAPNDLLDQRDQLLNQLAERVSITTLEQDNGMINVFIGNGQSLVVGTETRSLTAAPNSFDGLRLEVAYQEANLATNISDFIFGGKVGGILSFREQLLDPAFNALGRTVIGLTTAFNEQHALGLDLNGNLGGPLFNIAAPLSQPHIDNTTATNATVAIDNIAGLTTDNYILRFDAAGAWILENQTTDQNVAMTGSGTNADPFIVDGMSISVQPIGAVIGDSYRFLIQPTRDGGRDIDILFSDPALIAAAAPIRAESTFANLGTGEISQGTVTDVASIPLSGNGGDITLTFDPNALGAGVPGFTVTNGPGGTLAYDPATESLGKTFTLGVPFDGVSFEVAGVPATGDTFVITDNTSGVGDNRNALALSNFRSDEILVGGTASILESYNQMIGEVGTETRLAEVNRDAQSSLFNLAVQSRDSISGVNLDEEAANLLRFQQAYQAATRVIAAADTVFQELLGVIRG